MKVDVWIGWDSRMPEVADVAAFSMRRRSSIPLEIGFLKQQELVAKGLYKREIDPLASTEFTYSRFLAPLLSPNADIVIFVDNDFLWLHDTAELVNGLDTQKAVSCVQHDYHPPETVKMDGRVQTQYPRKNWSSLMVFNMARKDYFADLTLERANEEGGAYLHRLQWVPDEEIGALDPRWNWLEGTPEPAGGPFAVHYTRGGPWFADWQNVAYAEEWRQEREAFQQSLAKTQG